ncbi:Cysteine-rich RLK (RECEPTOR-like protein kinase) 8 [Quillaja saponaria]|uniref:Cysteine-rich RLK (RECEPTOR-like protein kinase) 8 n=1 Tax=Quillaja saponaria TaxID=32244 RepID=A0AAD7LTW7_QUISA|nr:Cysteine-rich RLK (RECEPTOR-like protein kinase) 8 [Quillaja saponaria]
MLSCWSCIVFDNHMSGSLLLSSVSQPIYVESKATSRQHHLDVAMCMFRYLKSFLGQGIFLPSSCSLNLRANCDSD